jgi:predicted SnoaL-like aldol condensation-catalyzing enzyme
MKLVMLALVAVTVVLTASPAAASKYFGPRYTQHNPRAADGPEDFRVFLQFLRVSSPMATT